MRLLARFFTLTAAYTMLAAAASAQTMADPAHPYGLDPYKPSDAVWLREFGAALVAQTPTAALAALDPYKPSHAALRRQVGGSMPLWGPYWFWSGPGMPVPLPPAVSTGLPAGLAFPHADDARGLDVTLTTRPSDSRTQAAAPPAYTATATLARPQTNDGISIRFDGRTWVATGRAVPRATLNVLQTGEHAGAPVFTRTDVNEDAIYLQIRDDLLAPFRARP